MKRMKKLMLWVIVALCVGCAQEPVKEAWRKITPADMPKLTADEYAAWKAKIDRVGIYQEDPDSEYGRKYRTYMARVRAIYDAELKKDPLYEKKLREKIMQMPKAGEERGPYVDGLTVYFERHKDDPEVKARFYHCNFYANDGETGFAVSRVMPWLQYSPAFTADDYEEAMKYHLLSYYEEEPKPTYEECLKKERQVQTPEKVRSENKDFNAPWVPILAGETVLHGDLL